MFFQALISQLLKLCITALIIDVFLSFSAVQIYDLSNIHLHSHNSVYREIVRVWNCNRHLMGNRKELFVIVIWSCFRLSVFLILD